MIYLFNVSRLCISPITLLILNSHYILLSLIDKGLFRLIVHQKYIFQSFLFIISLFFVSARTKTPVTAITYHVIFQVAAQVCRPHMLFLCLHAVCSPSKSFGISMEKCFMSEKNHLLKCYLKKKELNIVTASENL